jgi:excisionase family DNA binding protein
MSDLDALNHHDPPPPVQGDSSPSDQHPAGAHPDDDNRFVTAGTRPAAEPAAAQLLPLYTPAQAAKLLAVTESWLRRRAAARAIACTFLGKHLRFSPADLRAIVTAGAHHPTSLARPTRARYRGGRSTPPGGIERRPPTRPDTATDSTPPRRRRAASTRTRPNSRFGAIDEGVASWRG